jgi:hypothetical protein
MRSSARKPTRARSSAVAGNRGAVREPRKLAPWGGGHPPARLRPPDNELAPALLGAPRPLPTRRSTMGFGNADRSKRWRRARPVVASDHPRSTRRAASAAVRAGPADPKLSPLRSKPRSSSTRHVATRASATRVGFYVARLRRGRATGATSSGALKTLRAMQEIRRRPPAPSAPLNTCRHGLGILQGLLNGARRAEARRSCSATRVSGVAPGAHGSRIRDLGLVPRLAGRLSPRSADVLHCPYAHLFRRPPCAQGTAARGHRARPRPCFATRRRSNAWTQHSLRPCRTASCHGAAADRLIAVSAFHGTGAGRSLLGVPEEQDPRLSRNAVGDPFNRRTARAAEGGLRARPWGRSEPRKNLSALRRGLPARRAERRASSASSGRRGWGKRRDGGGPRASRGSVDGTPTTKSEPRAPLPRRALPGGVPCRCTRSFGLPRSS